MNEVTLIHPGGKLHAFHIPEYWMEVPSRAIRMRILRKVARQRDHIHAAMTAARIIMPHITQAMLMALPPQHRWEYYQLFNWVLKPDDTPPIYHFKHRFKKYYLPAAKLENARAIEFVLADEYYMKIIAGKDPEINMRLLAGVLCRRRSDDSAAAAERDDVRVPLLSRTESTRNADRLTGAHPGIFNMVFLYFTACKEFIHRVYGDQIFADGESTEPVGIEAALGWYAAFYDIATTGVFGDINQVMQTPIHALLQYMALNAVRVEKLKNKTPQKPIE